VAFGVGQFVASNYVSVQLTDIIASLLSAAAVVALVRVWHPVESPDLAAERMVVAGEDRPGGSAAGRAGALGDVPGPRGARPAGGAAVATADGGPGAHRAAARAGGGPVGSGRDGGGRDSVGDRVGGGADSGSDVARAYAPYLIIIAVFSIVNIGPVKTALARSPWTVKFAWPGLDVVGSNGKPVSSATFTFGWLPAAGTLMIVAGILTAVVLNVSARRALQAYADTYVELRYAIVTVMAVLALAYVLNQSGQTGTLGPFLAAAGGVFAF